MRENRMVRMFAAIIGASTSVALSACAPPPYRDADPGRRYAPARTIGSGPTGVMDSTTVPSSGNIGSGEINMPGAGNPANCSSAPTGQKPADC